MKRRAAMSEEFKAEYEKQVRRIKRFVRSATKRGYEFPEGTIPSHPKLITEASVRRVKNITPDTLYKKASYTKDTGERITGLEGRKHERQQAAIKSAQTRAMKAGKAYIPDTQNFSPRMQAHRKQKPKPTTKKPTQKQTKKKQAKRKPSKKKTNEKTPQEKYYEKSENKKGNRKTPPEQADVVTNNLLDGLHILDSLLAMTQEWQADSRWNSSLEIVKRRDKNVVANILQNAIDQLGKEQVAKNCEKAGAEIISMLEEILYASGSKEGNFKDGRTQVNFDIVRFQNLLLGRTATPEENIELVDLLESFMYEDADEDTEQYKTGLTATLSVKTTDTYNIE